MTTLASRRERNHSTDRHSSRNLPLKLSSAPFCQGLPESLSSVAMPAPAIHSRIARLTNSGPLYLLQFAAAVPWHARGATPYAPVENSLARPRSAHKLPGTADGTAPS